MRGALEHGSREKKIIIRLIYLAQGHDGHFGQKGMDCLGGIMATQGGCHREIQGLMRILSCACQIVNERLMKCVQKQIRAHALHATFFKSSALECIKNQNI
jgi:hypothetical protein